ncbi:T9SS type A sorting domain-containing protein [candidate division KSB1 bacterium]|nr:T9SS type A sorting domain-containing protein [candidate division KSB1 bacterium]
MQDYENNGSYYKITYDNDTFVEVDYEADTYTVQVEGKVIGKNHTTIYQKSDSTFLIYSRDSKTISVQLPEEFDENVSLLELSETGATRNVPFSILDRTLEFSAEAETPYKLIKTFPTSVDDNNELNNSAVKNYSLFQNYPNPFNPITTITYQIPRSGNVSLKVYDVRGRLIEILVNEKQDAGVHKIEWDASDLSSGVYFYTISADDFRSVRKSLLLK